MMWPQYLIVCWLLHWKKLSLSKILRIFLLNWGIKRVECFWIKEWSTREAVSKKTASLSVSFTPFYSNKGSTGSMNSRVRTATRPTLSGEYVLKSKSKAMFYNVLHMNSRYLMWSYSSLYRIEAWIFCGAWLSCLFEAIESKLRKLPNISSSIWDCCFWSIYRPLLFIKINSSCYCPVANSMGES